MRRVVERWPGEMPRGSRFAAICVLALSAGLGACKPQEVQFSRVPQLGVSEAETKPFETTIFANVPVDTTGLSRALDIALEGGLKLRTDVDKLACERRNSPWVECIGGYAVTEITRAGRVSLKAQGGQLVIGLPLKVEMAGRGYGWAQHLAERKTETVEAVVAVEAGLGQGYRAQVRVAREIAWSTDKIAILKAQVPLSSAIEPRLRSQIETALEPLRRQIAEAGIRPNVDQAWRALHNPIALGEGLWLRAEPYRVHGAGFTAEETGGASLRVGIAVRATVVGEAPAPLERIRALPEPARSGEAPQTTNLRLPMAMTTRGLEAAIQSLFPRGEIIETRADQRSPAMSVRTGGVTVRPARDRVAIEVQLDVVQPQRLAGMTGKAYFLARPVIREGTNVLAFDEIAFPQGPRRTEPQQPQAVQMLRIGEEPFAGRIEAAARLPIGESLAELLPQLNASVGQTLAGGLVLAGRFDAAEVVDVMPGQDSMRILLDVRGEMIVRPGGTIVTRPSLEPAGAAQVRRPPEPKVLRAGTPSPSTKEKAQR
ncbi:MAG: hypothetical protein RL291_1565 [Pseudomonadota bacterium]